MSDEKVLQILQSIEYHYKIVENASSLDNLNVNDMKKTLDNCLFIESACKKIKHENKVTEFEVHLNLWMKEKKLSKRQIMQLNCLELQKACDTFLEFSLKNSTIETSVIDQMIKYYIEKCGKDRLTLFLKKVLKSTFCINAILQILSLFDCTVGNLENEITLESWLFDVKHGNDINVREQIKNMLDNKEELSKLVQISYSIKTSDDKNDDNGVLYKIIIDGFSNKLANYDFLLFKILLDSKRKVLLKLLDNKKFLTSFLDATFYFGRNFKYEDDEWVSEYELTYDDIKNVVYVILNSSEDLYQLVSKRIQLAKQLDPFIWGKIQNDCMLFE